MADIVSFSQGTAIIVGDPASPSATSEYRTEELLRQLGRRLWILPEILLNPKSEFPVYAPGCHTQPRTRIEKQEFPRRVWDHNEKIKSASGDASKGFSDLLKHFSPNLAVLGPVLLYTTGLQCLDCLEGGERHPEDHVYTLMGFLPNRPEVVQNDTAYQAFARYVWHGRGL